MEMYRIHNIGKYQYIIWFVKTDLGKYLQKLETKVT